MRAFVGVGALLLGFVACTEEPELGSGNGQCVERKGTYLVRYTARTGDCGDVAETLLHLDKQPTAPEPPCSGSIAYSSDNCEVTYEQTCPNEATGDTAKITGKSKWSTDGATGAALESWTAVDASGRVRCAGTYEVTLARQ